MEAPKIEFSLAKTINYELKPFGKFKIKWKASEKLNKRKDILTLNELSFDYHSGMPCEGENDAKIIKFMIKHKTDVLTNGRFYYTRIGIGFTEITHPKLTNYQNYLNKFTTSVNDCAETWEHYINSND